MKDNTMRIEWLDGAKGVAIISVFLLHSLPCLNEIGSFLHIGQAVPVFLFISAYLISMRFESLRTYFTAARWKNLAKNILVPFLIVLVFQILCLTLSDMLPSWKSIVKNGGIGQGSYYAWLYMLVWMITPFIVILVRKVPVWCSLIIMLAISIFAEYLFVQMWDIRGVKNIFDLSPVRYLMVLYAGCIWTKLEKRQKRCFLVMACVSCVLMLADTHLAGYQLLANLRMGGEFHSFDMAGLSLAYSLLCANTDNYIRESPLFRYVESCGEI